MQAEIFRSAEAARTANAQLKEANAEMEAFSYSVSHDLRAPLRHIQGYVEMLSRDAQGTLSEKSERFLRTIAEATTEMATLIDDLLSFSRMARMGMETSRVDLNSIADEVRRTVSAETPGRNLEWHLSETPEVMGDPSMLRQVLVNLFRNAVKYTRPRDPAVIEMKHVGLNAGRAVFVVSDNGVGFDPRYAHKLFGVFQRLHRAEEFEGTGIGLANVRRIIARHGGTTWAQGTLGEGASFYFTLPLSEGRDIEQGEGL
jgi:light-regulated signal transduction histidine kinase (bacteriophytochrome)